MSKINWGRIVLGGLLAGVVINTAEFINYFVLEEAARITAQTLPDAQPDAQSQMTGGKIAESNLWGFLVGFLALWLYASIRPRFGPGLKTGIYAGTVVWALVFLQAVLRHAGGGSFATTAVFTGVVIGFVEINLGTLLGAWQYREAEHGAEEAGSADT